MSFQKPIDGTFCVYSFSYLIVHWSLYWLHRYGLLKKYKYIYLCTLGEYSLQATWDEADKICKSRDQSQLLTLQSGVDSTDLMDYMRKMPISTIWIQNRVKEKYTWLDGTETGTNTCYIYIDFDLIFIVQNAY